VRQVARLIVLLMAIGWLAVEIELGGARPPEAAGPEWRRTSEGWIKVGTSGPRGLVRHESQPAGEPALHPGLVAAFLLLAGVLSLALPIERYRHQLQKPKKNGVRFGARTDSDEKQLARRPDAAIAISPSRLSGKRLR
jgi:hypothetical protein